MTGVIFNIQKFCLHDGDGIRTTVFLKGCPLRCLWCHNPESQSRAVELMSYASRCTGCGACIGCPSGARSLADGGIVLDRSRCIVCGACAAACPNGAVELCGREVSAEEVFADVLRDKVFYDASGGGMTVSGGEPALQPEFTLALLRLAAENNIGAVIETCGYGARGFYSDAHFAGASFLYDLKALDPDKHKRLTGRSNDIILGNLLLLFEYGADVTLRLPLIPGVNDCGSDLDAAAGFLTAHAGEYRRAEIMAYHDLGISKERGLGRTPSLDIKTADEYQKERWRAEFARRGVDIYISE